MAELRLLIQGTLILCLLFNPTASTSSVHAWRSSGRCLPSERTALFSFKAGLSDPGKFLSSWKGQHCCQWRGIRCNNRTGHVVKLDLSDPDPFNYFNNPPVLGGEISSSLVGLHHLKYLNLSYNNFSGARIPEFLGALKNLRYLDLSDAKFGGRIPPQLGNLSNLLYLDLRGNGAMVALGLNIYSTDLAWLPRLSSLRYLDMSMVNLSTAADWAHAVNMLPSLTTLNLYLCTLQNTINPPLHVNLTKLEVLDLSMNSFNSPLAAMHMFRNATALEVLALSWNYFNSPLEAMRLFWNLPRLRHVDLSFCRLHGAFPDVMGNMTSLQTLSLKFNNLTGMIPTTFKNLCNLEALDLSENNINGDITELMERLSRCSWNGLQELRLSDNKLTGNLPSRMEHLSNLTTLDLRSNGLTGHIPLGIGALTKLAYLSLDSNKLDGVINEAHFARLASLQFLNLCNNSLTMVVGSNWVPPFRLKFAGFQSCQLGPKFPAWLRSQADIDFLDISNASIVDSIPDWFWTTFSATGILFLSENQISGTLPATLGAMAAYSMDFSFNRLEGPIPKLPRTLTYLDLSRNTLSGPLPSDFGAPMLRVLALFNNAISGAIPSSFCQLPDLEILDLSGNKLTGVVPNCWEDPEVGGSSNNNSSRVNSSFHRSASSNILILNLKSNNLSGEFPLFIQKCRQLFFLDLAYNQFSGNLPTWIGEKLASLALLRLRSNMFSGHIPVELSNINGLQYLDLACNNISGAIPQSLMTLTAMALTPGEHDALWETPGMSFDEIVLAEYTDNVLVVTKGQQLQFTTGIVYMVNLDLSCNSLIGQIPEEIGALIALKNLNFSQNHLSGNIPESIGRLQVLESFDLSHNKLSGEIPASLSALTALSHLNLSYNNLTGRIPSGNQLQTLDDPSIYVGNPGLCGPPLSKSCPGNEATQGAHGEEEDGHDTKFFYLGMCAGFVIGLWMVFCALLFKKTWRIAYFRLFDKFDDMIYVQVVVYWAILMRKFKEEE